MQTVPFYPPGAVYGCCFLTGSYELKPGQQAIDLQCDVETLPQVGQLVVSPQAVKMMVDLLGWEIVGPDQRAELDGFAALRTKYDALVEAVAGLVNLPVVERALAKAAEQAEMATIGEWIDTMPAKAEM
jgi:hypothetical protein